MAGGQRHKLPPHEAASTAEAIEGPSNRSFGLVVGGILMALAALRFGPLGHQGPVTAVLGVAGAVLVALALIAPAALTTANRLWMKLGALLGLVMTPIVMGLLYLTTFLPIGLAMRAGGHDPLRRRRKTDGESYWVVRTPPGPEPKTMPNQF